MRQPDHPDHKLLSGAVRAALTALSDRVRPDPGERPFRTTTPARIARYLRAAAVTTTRPNPDDGGVLANVAAACTALDEGDLHGARAALRVAQSALRVAQSALREGSAPDGRSSERARTDVVMPGRHPRFGDHADRRSS